MIEISLHKIGPEKVFLLQNFLLRFIFEYLFYKTPSQETDLGGTSDKTRCTAFISLKISLQNG